MLLDILTKDLHASMKSGDKVRTETIRYLIAAVKKFEIDTYPPKAGGSLTDENVVKIIRQQVKTHKESIGAFEKGVRTDLVEKEKAELAILITYLPAEVADDEIENVVSDVISHGVHDFGQVMGTVMKKLTGRANGERVAILVREKLADSVKR